VFKPDNYNTSINSETFSGFTAQIRTSFSAATFRNLLDFFYFFFPFFFPVFLVSIFVLFCFV